MTHAEIGECVLHYNFQIEDFNRVGPQSKCPSFDFPLSVNGLRTKWEVVVRPFQKENDVDGDEEEPLACRNVNLDVRCIWASVTKPSIIVVSGISGRDEFEKVLKRCKREENFWRGTLIPRVSLSTFKLLKDNALNFYLKFFISPSTITRAVDSLACLATELGLLRERSEEHADVLLLTSDGKEIPAHGSILRARSSLLKAQGKGLLQEEEESLDSPSATGSYLHHYHHLESSYASDKENLEEELRQDERRSYRNDSLSSGYHSQVLTSPEPTSDTSRRESSPSPRGGTTTPSGRSLSRSKRTMTPVRASPTKRLATFSRGGTRSPAKPSGGRGPSGLPASPRNFRTQRETPGPGGSPYMTPGHSAQNKPPPDTQSPRTAANSVQRHPLTPKSSSRNRPSPSPLSYSARRLLDFSQKPSHLATAATTSPSYSSALFKPPITITPPSPPNSFSSSSSVGVGNHTTPKKALWGTPVGSKDEHGTESLRTRSPLKVTMSASITTQMLTWLYEGHAPQLARYSRPLLVAGIRYHVPSLAHACQDHLARHVTPKTCPELLLLADKYRALDLRQAVLEFAVANAREVTALGAWTRLITERPHIAVDFSVRLANRS